MTSKMYARLEREKQIIDDVDNIINKLNKDKEK